MIRKLGLCLSLCLVLLGCRSEEEVVLQESQKEEFAQKFKVFQPQEDGKVYYAKGFAKLLIKYDSIYGKNITGRVKANINLGKANSYIEFNIHSEVYTGEQGEKWIIFPKIKENKVSGLVIGVLSDEETKIRYSYINPNTEFYKENIKSFEEAVEKLNKSHHTNKKKRKNIDDEEVKEITEVVIIKFRGPMRPVDFIDDAPDNFLDDFKTAAPIIPENKCSLYYNCISGGGGYSPPPKPEKGDPCTQTKEGKKEAEKILKDANVAQHMDNFLRGKVTSAREWAVAIGRNSDGSYSVSEPNMGGATSGVVPSVPSGVYVADGHTHPGSSGAPSGGDLYGMLEIMQSNPDYTTRFVYGDYFGSEVYALVITDRNLARQFLSQYPRSSNYDENSHKFLTGTPLGDDFRRIEKIKLDGYYNYSQVQGYSSAAIGMAYILDKYNTGLALLKQDINGNFQPFRIKDQEIKTSDGVIKPGVNITPCP